MAEPAIIGSGGWTRLRELGRGASGAAVFLAADDSSGELFVVKSAGGAAASQLLREWSVMSGLSSPHVLKCLGFRAGGRRGEQQYRLFLEFAPGGSLADAAARGGGRLEEGAAAAYAADVLSGLGYLHGRRIVHGDVKGSNVVVGADGRAKLADFGCARAAGDASSAQALAGTPAFMAPEVARGEEQGPAADVWALGCTVIEMATGRAPWGDEDDNVLAVLRRIGLTDAEPAVPPWLSSEAKDFLGRCFRRRAGDRSTAEELLRHPFVAAATPCGLNDEAAKAKAVATWVSPTSVLDAALWESETDDEGEDAWSNPACRIRAMAMACRRSAWPAVWDSGDGWMDVLAGDDDNEVSECLTQRMKALACPASSVPDWDADMAGWTVVFSPPPTAGGADSEEIDDVAAADEPFSEAVCSVGGAVDRG